MEFLKISLGFAALFLAWGLLFRTGLIFRLNAWLKENVFNDQIVLYSRRRLALLLFVLGMVALFSGMDSVFHNTSISEEGAANLLSQAQMDFKSHQYLRVVSICRTLLKAEPRNISARELLSQTFWVLSRREEAFHEARILNHFDPTNETARLILSKKTEAKGKS